MSHDEIISQLLEERERLIELLQRCRELGNCNFEQSRQPEQVIPKYLVLRYLNARKRWLDEAHIHRVQL